MVEYVKKLQELRSEVELLRELLVSWDKDVICGDGIHICGTSGPLLPATV